VNRARSSERRLAHASSAAFSSSGVIFARLFFSASRCRTALSASAFVSGEAFSTDSQTFLRSIRNSGTSDFRVHLPFQPPIV